MKRWSDIFWSAATVSPPSIGGTRPADQSADTVRAVQRRRPEGDVHLDFQRWEFMRAAFPMLGKVVWLVCLLLVGVARADDTGVFSSVVSYQYYDAVGEDTNSPVVSPVVSYQYFDAPTNVIFQAQTGPSVSYYYQIGNGSTSLVMRGTVTDTTGAGITGATVKVSVGQSVVAQTTTDATGHYALPSLESGVYVLQVSAASYARAARALTLNATSALQDFQLAALPAPPAQQQVARQPPPAFSPPPAGPMGSILKVFDGTSVTNLTANNAPSSNLMTIVLTHGWVPGLPDPSITNTAFDLWPLEMARQLRANGVTHDIANIVVWDWRYAAQGVLPPEENTAAQGVVFGQQLQLLLGQSYTQKVHFSGHSLGTMLNAAAANYLHGDRTAQQAVSATPWSSDNTHMTLFDQAEVARMANIQVLFDGLTVSGGSPLAILKYAAQTLQGWKPSMPVRSAWADNYISYMGFYMPNAFNVALQKAAGLAGPIQAHSYPMEWYDASIANPSATLLGLQQSFEYVQKAGLPQSSFPSELLQVGDAYHQNPASSDMLALEPLPAQNFFQLIVPLFGNKADFVVHGVVATVQVAGNVAAEIGQAAQQAGQMIGQGFDYAGSIAAQGGQACVNLLNSAVLHLRLSTGTASSSPQFSGTLLRTMDVGGGTTASNASAMAWVPVYVPSNAVAMAFDFSVSGDPSDDVLVCGIGTNNLFSLEAKYIPTNSVSASRLIDVTAWAGATNELFFGLMGGTSTNATLDVDNIRFYNLQPPVASFSATPTNGAAPLAVNFTDASTGTITNWFWDFGDGLTTNIAVAGVAHTYANPGTNTVALIVSGPLGSTTNTLGNYITVLTLVTVAANPSNGGVVLGGGSFGTGASAQLSAVASNNWLFTAWNDGDTNTVRTITVPTTNSTYTANFAPAATINVGANTNAGGSVTGSGIFLVGSNALLTASASNGWQFIAWSDGATNNPRNIMVASNTSYTAVFAPTALITVQPNPVAGGSVTGGGTYVVSSNATLTATASNLWQFMGWSDGNTNASRSVIVPDGGATYTANFAALGTVATLANPTNGGSTTGDGLYLLGSNATVTALASNAWTFLNWNGSITNNPWTFTVVSNGIVCTANFARISTVSTLANPAGAGAVSGGGTFIVGSNVTLIASASNGWLFAHWNDGATNSARTITVPATNITYTANFAAAATVSVAANTNAGGSVTGSGIYFVGSNDVLTATASNGWRFIRWSDGSTNNPRTVVISSNTSYTAVFAPTALLTVQPNPTAGGSVTGGGTYVVGSNAQLTATASNLWLFMQWNDGETNAVRTVVVPDGGATYTATFAPLGAVATLANPTNGGSTTGDGPYLLGSNATVAALASNTWTFLNWNGSITNNPWTFTVVSSGIVCTANFARISTVSTLANPAGTGAVTGGGVYLVGSNVTLTASASNGWLFAQWNDGATNSVRTITVPATNVTYTAHFAAAATITVGANTNAGGSVTGGGIYFVGSNDVLTATASNGWQFIRWSDGSTNNPRTIVISSNTTYTAVFAPTALLTVQPNPTAGGSVTGGGTYVVGSNATLSAVASNLWRFTGWNDGNTNATRSITVPLGGATYTANFAALGVVNLYATAGGRATGGGTYLAGTNILLTAIASNGWAFVNWTGGVTNNPWLFTLTNGTTICTANFARASTVTTLASPVYGGSIAGGGIYFAGSNALLTATPAPGWAFSRWNDGNTSASRNITVPATNSTYTATFGTGLGLALNASNFTWTTGGSAPWSVQTTTTRDGVAARSGAISTGQQTWMQTTTNGPLSLLFWWKVSSAPTNYLQFYINTQLVSQISGNVNWNQYVTFLGTTNQYTLKWVYTKNSAAVSGSDAGFVDQVTVLPCPYATNVPALFFQDASGLLASWILNSTGGLQFARVLANSGNWALKTAGDINGDGVSDLIFQNSASDTGGWFLNADGSVRDARFWFNIGGWEIKAAGDYDGAGRAQLFFQTARGDVAYWRLDTNGAFQSAVSLGSMSAWKLRGAGDLDKDGKAELFWQNAAGQVVIWYHNPNGSIRSALAFTTGEWALCGVTDVDGDGVCDLIWQAPDSRTGGWFMQTNGIARDARFWWPTGGWKLKAAGR